MNLLVLSSWFPFPPHNGSKLRANALLAVLASRHRVTLLSFAEPGEEAGVEAARALCPVVRIVPGNPYKAGGRLGLAGFFSALPRSLACTDSRQMQALVDAHAPGNDAALALQLGTAHYLRTHGGLARVLDEVEVGVIRDLYRDAPAGPTRARRRLSWWKLGRYVRRLVDEFDATTVVSEIERDHLASVGCDVRRVHVLANGTASRHLTVTEAAVPTRLVYPGSVTYEANRDAVSYFLTAIYPSIRARRPDVTLHVTGDVGDVDTGRLTGGDASVIFTGRVPDIARAVARSAVCVVPLRAGGGTRLKVLEAMALGVPVVSTEKGVEGLEVVEDRDLLIGRSPDEFAAHVLRLLEDRALRERLAWAGRALVADKYTWDRIGVALDGILERAARRGAAAPGRQREADGVVRT